MHSLVAFTVFGVDWEFFKPYIVLGLALGGVYALSGVGLVVLYRATGVLNLAFGAIGAAGALIACWMINHTGWPHWLAYVVCVAFGGVVTLALRARLRPRLRAPRPAREDDGHARARTDPARADGVARARRRRLRPDPHAPELQLHVHPRRGGRDWTQIIAIALAIVLTVGTTLFLRQTRLGTAMRALANDREITATLGVPVRRVEAAAWLGSGLVCGAAGLLLADLLQSLDYSALTFLVISALAAALIGRLSSLWATLLGGLAIGIAQAILNPVLLDRAVPAAAPFVIAIIALLWLGGGASSSSRGRRGSVSVTRTGPGAAAAARAATRARPRHRRARRSRSPVLLAIALFVAPARWRRLDRRRSRASRSTRSWRRASGSSTAGSG